MIVVDTSAWIELLRGSGTPVRHTLDRLLEEDADLAVTEMIVAEVLAGARGERHREELRRRLVAFPVLSLNGLTGFLAAADLYRTARARGVTVRKLADCMIAVPVLREDAELLHADADFDHLARVVPLRVVPLDE